ncbi:MAG: hypothetical protein WEB06_20420 [Actinomycetota bacterium]
MDDYNGNMSKGTSGTSSAEMTESEQNKMSRAEAGRKGGLSTKQRYGGDHFSRIGRLGGKKGGESTKRRYGVEFYQRIGRKGGSS